MNVFMEAEMRMLRLAALLFMVSAGCRSFDTEAPPETPGAVTNAPSYGYTPIDPLPVEISNPGGGEITNQRLLASLPDETIRLAVGDVEGNAGISFGPAKVGYSGRAYVVILDYGKFTTESLPFKSSQGPTGAGSRPRRAPRETVGAQAQTEERNAEIAYRRLPDSQGADVILPAYIGVGVRLTANLVVNEGSVDLGNLLAIGIAARAKRVSGSLVIQTLGITGTGISTAIPLPSDINTTSIQNALVALGTIKSKMYDAGTVITPRVIGVYNTVGGGRDTVSGFIGAILTKPLRLVVH